MLGEVSELLEDNSIPLLGRKQSENHYNSCLLTPMWVPVHSRYVSTFLRKHSTILHPILKVPRHSVKPQGRLYVKSKDITVEGLWYHNGYIWRTTDDFLFIHLSLFHKLEWEQFVA